MNIDLDELPIHAGVHEFALENGLLESELVLFGGEEYELVCTFKPEHRSLLAKHGILKIGQVNDGAGKRFQVRLNGKPVARKGWVHFKSEN